ncbi:hypothetical protein MYP_4048 [Sporocytophaga myxococcoides]|uniref:Uncharacterized protein n=1 Tax=Sporocytophaga myxococcoides TaxID=153721 RepID=A0A098LL65_9BACT|nr:hypothetical protein [Sporocytophaga myxococcoides]GAL86818.1 hypothetical protein MYP_4048 [Sporocytophaga myxococcoides]
MAKKYNSEEEITSDFKELYKKLLESEIPKPIIFDALLNILTNSLKFKGNKLIKGNELLSVQESKLYRNGYESVMSFIYLEKINYEYKLKQFGINVDDDDVYTIEYEILLKKFGFESPWNIFNDHKIETPTFNWLKSNELLKKLFSLLTLYKLIDANEDDFLSIFSGMKLNRQLKITWNATEPDLAYLIDQLTEYSFIPINTQYHSIISRGKYFYNSSNKAIQNIKQAKYALQEKNLNGTKNGQIIDLIINKLNNQ